ncbi:hypothetical protein WICPIJ_002861 [Wickerhamomyces pijperi]|uniref:Uncharacterized protein n=1 Tax=Wickerhamomyces pijperi TaxID=599730 RepID=A0A9P8Q8V3_WICPI|nr:hypothetical protein WICPIJ_002861 [Wickerhamomyces pijperi]
MLDIVQDFREPDIFRVRRRDLSSSSETTSFMIRSGDDNCLYIGFVSELQNCSEGLIIGKNFVDLGSWVIVVASMINSGTFNHKEEPLF